MITFNTKTIIYILLAYLILVIISKTIRGKSFDEMFVLPIGVLTNVNNLSKGSYYTVGKLNPDINTTQTGANFGGSGCTSSFPSTVYIPYVSTSVDDAICVQTITSIYSDVPQTTSSCSGSNGTNFYRMLNKQSNIVIDTLQSSGGLTITSAKYSGKTCSQQFSSLPTSSYIGFAPDTSSYLGTGTYSITSAPSYCSPINAVCNYGDALYQDTNQSCTQPTAGVGFFRYFTKKTSGLESLTINSAKFGGNTCSTILLSSIYPNNKYVNVITGSNGNPFTGPFDKTVISSTGGFVTSYCPSVDSRCNISDSLLYTDPGASGGTNGTCFSSDTGLSFFRNFNKKVDNFETSIYTTAQNLYGGRNCSTQISTLPTNKYIGVQVDTSGNPVSNPRNIKNYNGLLTSYCQYADATCKDTTIDNQITNYTTSTSTPLLGQCQYNMNGTPLCDQNTNKQYQRVTITSPVGTYLSCPVQTISVNGVSGTYIPTLPTCPTCRFTSDINYEKNNMYCKTGMDSSTNAIDVKAQLYSVTNPVAGDIITPIGSYYNASCPYNFNDGYIDTNGNITLPMPVATCGSVGYDQA